MTDSTLTLREKNLLLYCESRCVDDRGSLHQKHLNAEDLDILDKWKGTGFVKFGRIASASPTHDGAAYWCELSDEAWLEAHQERKDRAKRMSERRTWRTTEELRADDY